MGDSGGASRKWLGIGDWGEKLESRKASKQNILCKFAGASLIQCRSCATQVLTCSIQAGPE